jgi:hypothetical protein
MVQAKDIPDEAILDHIPTWPQTISGWDVARAIRYLGDSPIRPCPQKAVNAKLRSMAKRGLVEGCPCGCRGDWHIPPAGRIVR